MMKCSSFVPPRFNPTGPGFNQRPFNHKLSDQLLHVRHVFRSLSSNITRLNHVQKDTSYVSFPSAVGVHQDGGRQSSGEDIWCQISEVSVAISSSFLFKVPFETIIAVLLFFPVLFFSRHYPCPPKPTGSCNPPGVQCLHVSVFIAGNVGYHLNQNQKMIGGPHLSQIDF